MLNYINISTVYMELNLKNYNMSGWLKLHRQIQENWIYKEKRKFSKLEAWIDIILTVNYSECKTLIKGKLIHVKRGESILSLDSWAIRWNWDKSSVRRFFYLLQQDGMIELKNETVTTRLTVCKYDSYQGEDSKSETQVKRKRNASETQTTPIEEVKEGSNKTKQEKENKLILFDSWWYQYSYKHDRKACEAIWIKLSFEEINKILDVVSTYVKSTPDITYRLKPINYLKRKAWDNEIIFKQQNNGTTTQQPRKSLDQQADEITARVFGINPTQTRNNEHTNTDFEEADWSNAD